MPTANELGVDVQRVVSDVFQLEGRVRGKEFDFICPAHDDHNPSAGANLETGFWRCFSCGASGDLISLGMEVFKITRKESYRLLLPGNTDSQLRAVQKRLRALQTPSGHPSTPVPPSEAPRGLYSDGPLDSLTERGFSKETLKKWKIKFCKKQVFERPNGHRFTITNSIAIPIYAESWDLLGYCYRTTKQSEKWQPRYLYSPGINLAENWLGLNFHGNQKKIVVCEGALDAIWCDQNNIPAIAILGSQFKQETKVNKLTRYREVVVFTDRDDAGALAALSLGTLLHERGVPCRVVRYPQNARNRRGELAKDPQDLCPLDLEIAVERAVPFLTWKHKAGILRKAGNGGSNKRTVFSRATQVREKDKNLF